MKIIKKTSMVIGLLGSILSLTGCVGGIQNPTETNKQKYYKIISKISDNMLQNAGLKNFKYLGYEMIPVDDLHLEIENYKQPYYVGIIGDACNAENKKGTFVNYYKVSKIIYNSLLGFYKDLNDKFFENNRVIVKKENIDSLMLDNDTSAYNIMQNICNISSNKPKWTTNFSFELRNALDSNKAINYTITDIVRNKEYDKVSYNINFEILDYNDNIKNYFTNKTKKINRTDNIKSNKNNDIAYEL